MLYNDDVARLKRLFIDTSISSGCNVAYTTEEYINIIAERKKLTDKLLSFIPQENIREATIVLDDICSTFNQESSLEFDNVLGIIFDRINMLPELISAEALKGSQKESKN